MCLLLDENKHMCIYRKFVIYLRVVVRRPSLHLLADFRVQVIIEFSFSFHSFGNIYIRLKIMARSSNQYSLKDFKFIYIYTNRFARGVLLTVRAEYYNKFSQTFLIFFILLIETSRKIIMVLFM